MKKTLIAFGAFALLTAVGCKKDDENENLAVTKENVAGSYKLASMKATVNGSEVDAMAGMEPCYIDDVLTLKADLSYTHADAGTKCSPDGSFDDTWSINGNTIEIYGESATIKTLTKKQMVTTQTGDYNGVTATVTTTFNKQ